MKVWLMLSLLLLSACGESKLEPLKSGDLILAFGDSLTAGKGVSSEQAYPSVLSDLSGFDVFNAGISGETTAEGLQRLPGVLDQTEPALVVLFEGGNDILRNHNLSETKQNLEKMILLAKGQGAQVVLVGLPRKQLFSDTAELYKELADTHSLPIEDDIVASLLRKPSMKSDSVHFNAAGYRELAKEIHATLEDAGLY